MASINIPDGLLKPDELRELQNGVDEAVRQKEITGSMNMQRFINIIKSVCSWIWDKISGFISDLWGGLCDLF